MVKSVIVSDSPSLEKCAQNFAAVHGLDFLQESADISADMYVIHFSEEGHYLSWSEGKNTLSVKPDFTSGANAHRQKFGGGKSQMLAKAVGLQGKKRPSILDATAGFGGDAFVLAGLGASVAMLERSCVAYLLLESALSKACSIAESHDIHDDVRSTLSRMCLQPLVSAQNFLQTNDKAYDVIYLDPMFPERKKKSALVKKDMRAFHTLIGDDADADELLPLAVKTARHRVVVKRPKLAPFLANIKPTYQLTGKSTRFDIYVIKAF